MPLLSIIVPVYNTEEYLRQCLDSIISQNNGDMEVILVDDGSTDSSGAICDKYAERYSQIIRVIHQKNQGLLLARRTGIKASHGDYISHVDADDYLLDGAINTICHTISEHPCDMLFFDYIYGAGQGKPERLIRIREEKEITVIPEKNMIIQQFLFGAYFNNMWMKVTKRSVVDIETDYSPFRVVANGEDVLQSLALIDRSISFVYIPQALYYYRRDNISMSKSYGTKDYDSFKAVQTEMLKYAKKWEISEKQIWDLLSSFIGKNMVILHQVKQYEGKEAFYRLMNRMSRDDYYLGLKDGLKSPKTSKYYRIVYQLICHKKFRITELFINTVAKLKSKG